MTRLSWGGGRWVLLLIWMGSLPAWAGLGGGLDSVAGDAAEMKGQLSRRTEAALYSVHEIAIAQHTVVREYVSSSGIVFGVAWDGPVAPDLEQVMGVHFAHLAAALNARPKGVGGRRPLSLRDGDLVFETHGHALAYSGRAFIPSLVPAGLSSEVVQ